VAKKNSFLFFTGDGNRLIAVLHFSVGFGFQLSNFRAETQNYGRALVCNQEQK
jgi:hypothetical protein